MLTTKQTIQRISRYDPGELTLLLGAGASKSSRISLAAEMMDEWRKELFESRASDDERKNLTVAQWCAANPDIFSFVGADDEYSQLFELCYPTPASRQKYIEQKIKCGSPGWGYLYLANMMVYKRRFTTVFTTNFDDLLNEALTRFLHHNPAICNGDAEVDEVSFLSDRAKIVKLHGDYLFRNLRNTTAELQNIGARMANRFADLARQRGLVVIGYAGRDESIMHMMERLFADKACFPNSVFWGLRQGEPPSRRVAALSKDSRFQLFECQDFDTFMEALHAELKLDLPPTILSPHMQLDSQLVKLAEIADENNHKAGSPIHRDAQQLRHQIGRPIEAELALGQRDDVEAFRLADKHIRERGATVAALTVRAEALAIQAEREGREDLIRLAVTDFEQAIKQDGKALPPRYGLARLFNRQRKVPEAIQACEELARLVRHDRGLRRNLIQLYLQAQRITDAEREVNELANSEPAASDLHWMRSMIRTAQGRTHESIVELEKAIALDATNASLRFAIAQQLISHQRLREAEAHLDQGLKLDPNNPSALVNMGHLIMPRQPVEAGRYYERAAQFNPESAEVQGFLGEYYIKTEQPAKAEASAREAIRLAPHDARLWSVLAHHLMRMNRFEESEQAFREARRINPSMGQPAWFLGLFAIIRQDGRAFEEAAQALAQVDQMAAQQLRMQGPMIAQQMAQARATQQFAPQKLLNQAQQWLASWQSPGGSHPPTGAGPG
ncbi:MAG: tetratricopeptide repeat protein [Nitrospira sp.]|nr:MAG: tetratricopeptide repeat protein [Nitrospira sp.]